LDRLFPSSEEKISHAGEWTPWRETIRQRIIPAAKSGPGSSTCSTPSIDSTRVPDYWSPTCLDIRRGRSTVSSGGVFKQGRGRGSRFRTERAEALQGRQRIRIVPAPGLRSHVARGHGSLVRVKGFQRTSMGRGRSSREANCATPGTSPAISNRNLVYVQCADMLLQDEAGRARKAWPSGSVSRTAQAGAGGGMAAGHAKALRVSQEGLMGHRPAGCDKEPRRAVKDVGGGPTVPPANRRRRIRDTGSTCGSPAGAILRELNQGDNPRAPGLTASQCSGAGKCVAVLGLRAIPGRWVSLVESKTRRGRPRRRGRRLRPAAGRNASRLLIENAFSRGWGDRDRRSSSTPPAFSWPDPPKTRTLAPEMVLACRGFARKFAGRAGPKKSWVLMGAKRRGGRRQPSRPFPFSRSIEQVMGENQALTGPPSRCVYNRPDIRRISSNEEGVNGSDSGAAALKIMAERVVITRKTFRLLNEE